MRSTDKTRLRALESDRVKRRLLSDVSTRALLSVRIEVVDGSK